MDNLIDRQAALDAIMGQPPEPHYPSWYAAQIEKLPAAQPDHNADVSKKVEQTGETAQNVQNEDLISRKAAIDAVSEYATFWMSYTDDMSASDIAQEAINSAKDTMIRILKEQPTVQPECKQAEWINEGRIIRCSKCKIGYAVVKGMKSAITYNFCPSCGADMRGGDSR